MQQVKQGYPVFRYGDNCSQKKTCYRCKYRIPAHIVGDHNVQLGNKFAHLAKIAKICL